MSKYIITCTNPAEIAVFKHNSHIRPNRLSWIHVGAGLNMTGEPKSDWSMVLRLSWAYNSYYALKSSQYLMMLYYTNNTKLISSCISGSATCI